MSGWLIDPSVFSLRLQATIAALINELGDRRTQDILARLYDRRMRRLLAVAVVGLFALAGDAAAAERAHVTRVLDGDTLQTTRGRVRVWGLNTPELRSQCPTPEAKAAERAAGIAAGMRTTELVVNGISLERVPRVRDRDRYGRKLREVLLPDGRSLAAILIAEGHGVFYDGHGRAALMFCPKVTP